MNALNLASDNIDQLREHAHAAAALLKAMANEHRLLVLCALAPGELTVGEINARVPLAQSALSQHLARLRGFGLVMSRRDGLNIYYRVKDGPAARIMEILYETFCGPEARP